MRVCTTPGCPTIHPSPGRCPTCAAAADKTRRPNGNPYNTRGHHTFRAAVLARHPYCADCHAPSTIADHHPTERIDLITQGLNPNDPNYGVGRCKTCHDKKTARTKPSGWNNRDT